MKDYLNHQEKADFELLRSIFIDVVEEYKGDSAEYHAPHGIAEFSHMFYHAALEPAMIGRTKELLERLVAGEEVEGAELRDDGGVSLSPFHSEEVFRWAFEAAVIVGIEFGRKWQRKATECRCIEGAVDEIEGLLRRGEWGHA